MSSIAHCPFTIQVLMKPMLLSPYAFNKYLRKHAFYHSPSPSIKVYKLPCGCFVWVHSSGVRQLSAFPF
ncbi:MAG: hypothetical protein ACT4ON_01060 [Bacteroidota bacterium]